MCVGLPILYATLGGRWMTLVMPSKSCLMTGINVSARLDGSALMRREYNDEISMNTTYRSGTNFRYRCNWCLRAYGETELSDDTTWTDACERNSLPISPMPASILAIASSFNATNTYLIAGATGGSSAIPTGGSGSSSTTRATTGLNAGGLGSALPSQTQASSSTLSATATRQTSTTTLLVSDAGAVSSTPAGGSPGATVTITAGGGGTSRVGGSASGLDIKAPAAVSFIVAMMALIGIAMV